MASERSNSGAGGDGRRRASSRASSTSAQSARRRGNRRLAKALPSRIPERARGLVRRLFAALIGPVGGRALRGALAAGGAAVLLIGAVGAWRAVTTSPTFALDDIQVTGLSRAAESEIRALAAVESGDNAVALDTDEVAHLVEKHPWVARAQVIRRLPRGLTIEVTEHQPVALVALEHLYYVDADGEVVKRLVPGEQDALPVITGLSREDVERGDALALSQIRAALAFEDAWLAKRPLAALDEIHVGPAGEITAGLTDPPLRAHLGRAPWDEALARLTAVQAELDSRALVAREIDVWSERHPERAVARLKTGRPRERGTTN